MFERCKVVMLPTNKKSNIYLELNNPEGMLIINNLISLYDRERFKDYFPQHLYILSDEEIKEGDCWAINKNNDTLYFLDSMGVYDSWLKVIASTDPSLNLPIPSQSFIEEYTSEYTKGNKIEEVLVEFEAYDGYPPVSFMPDTLKVNPKDNTITIKRVKDSWTRDEVTNLCENAYDSGRYSIIHKDIEQTFDKWVKTNL